MARLWAAVLGLAAIPAALSAQPAAQPGDRTVPVRFSPGSTGAQYRGTVQGYQSINYVVRAQAGQRLTVQFRTANRFAYFNIWAPGATEAAFIGSEGASETGASGGYSHDLPVTVSGEQRIQVYLMRNEARRRGANAPFTIDIAVYGEPGPAR